MWTHIEDITQAPDDSRSPYTALYSQNKACQAPGPQVPGYRTAPKVNQFSSVHSLSHVWLFAQNAMNCSTSGIPVHQLLEFTQTHVHWVGDAIQLSHPLSPLFLLPSIFPSIRVFSNESALLIRWPKYWSFSVNVSPSSEHPGQISFRMDWLDLLAVKRTLRSLPHHSSKASILWHSAFFIVQFSHPYLTTGKTIALTRQTFVDNSW